MKKPDFSHLKLKLSEAVEKITYSLRKGSSGLLRQNRDFFSNPGERTREILKKKDLSFYATGLAILICAYFLSDLTGLIINSLIPDPGFVRSARRFNSSSDKA